MSARAGSRLGVVGVVAVLAACGESRPRTLVVLTPFEPEALERVERRFEEAHADVDVRMARLPDGRLSALRGGGVRADVLWGFALDVLAEAAAEEMLVPSTSGWAAGLPAHPEGLWHALPGATPFVLAFNVRQVPRTRVPRDWRDLLHPRWSGELVLLDPAADARARTLLASFIVQELRRTGEEHAGFDYLLGLDRATGVYVSDVRDALRRLEIGEGSLTVLPLDEVTEARAGADWLEHRTMESGAPALFRGVAVLAGVEDPDAAAAFVELVGSAAAAVAPAPVPATGAATWPPAPDTVAERRAAWMARWSDEVRGRGAIR